MATAKERAAAKLAEAELEDRIAATVPPGGRVSVHDLHGTVARVAYGDNYRIVGRQWVEGPDPRGPVSWDRAVELAELLPPTAMVQLRDASLSFPPAEYVDAIPEAKRERAEVTEVGPVRVDLGAFPKEHGSGYDPHVSIGWYTRVSDIGLVEVKVALGAPPKGVLEYSVERRRRMGGFRYTDPRVRVFFTSVLDGGEPVATVASPIRWAAGSDEYPADRSIVFHLIGARREPGVYGRLIVQRIADLAAGRAPPEE